ncbi:hypothetical protein Q9R29_08520 [Rothia sp. ARF10]|nr:hypothetical protein [Rothia sp. ARF10]
MSDRPSPLWRIPLVRAWVARDVVVDRAMESKGPRMCRLALHTLGVTEDRLAMYYEVCTEYEEPTERPYWALDHLATMAKIAVDDGYDYGGSTADDLLAWEIVQFQRRPGPDGYAHLSYWDMDATRHAWALAAAEATPMALARWESPLRYEDLSVLAAKQGVRMPRLAPGEDFEPPSKVFGHAVQPTLGFKPGPWASERKKPVSDPLD